MAVHISCLNNQKKNFPKTEHHFKSITRPCLCSTFHVFKVGLFNMSETFLAPRATEKNKKKEK